MLKKFLVVIAVLSFSFSVVAQNIEGVNARLDGMAGSGASDDIGWTIRHPASIFNYPNNYQATICLMDIPGIGVTYGAIIGIVQFSELFYAGLVLNNRIVMGTGFYEEGSHFLNAPHIDGADNAKGFPNIPAVNLCLKLSDNFQIGLGGYFEGSSYDLKDEKKLPYDTLTGAVADTIIYFHEHDNKRLRNMGFNVEVRFKAGGWTIYPQVIVGFPQMMGGENYDTLDGAMEYIAMDNAASPQQYTNLRHTYSSPEGLYLRGGSYFWGDIGNTFWLAGALYENVRFQFKRNTIMETGMVDVDGSLVGDTLLVSEDFDTTHSDHNSQWVHYFLCMVPSFSDNLYFSPEYDGGIGWFHGNDPDLPPDTTFFMMYHNFRLGIEKFIDDFWWFDKLGIRCGMSAQWNKEWRHVDGFDYATGTSDESIPWKSFFWGSDFAKKEAKITGGFGVTKGRGTFDISCDFLKWQGQSVLTGPAAAMASMTIDFSRKKEF